MTTAEKINKEVANYQEIDLEKNPASLGELIKLRQRLTGLCYDLGVQCAKYKREYDSAYWQRKSKFFVKKLENVDQMTLGDREARAETAISDLREEEKTAESMYQGTKIILHQANEVLNAMQQDIAILREERK